MKIFILLLLTFALGSTNHFQQKSYKIRAILVSLSSATIKIDVDQKDKAYLLKILIDRKQLKIEIDGELFAEPISGKSVSSAKKSFTNALCSSIKRSNILISKDAEYLSVQIVKLLDTNPLNYDSNKFLWEQVTKLDEIKIFL